MREARKNKMYIEKHPNDDGYRVWLEPYEYETLIECAEKDRAKIALRMGGESGLRKNKVLDLCRSQIKRSDNPDVKIHMVYLMTKDTRTSNSEKMTKAWMPPRLLESIDRYIDRKYIKDDEPIYRYSSTTLDNDITAAKERAAEKTGKDDFRHFTFHDLRRYFATNMYYRYNVSAEYVAVLGGWEDVEYVKDNYFYPYFDDLIQNELVKKDVMGIKDIIEHESEYEKLLNKLNYLSDRIDQLEQKLGDKQEEPDQDLDQDTESGKNQSVYDWLQ